MLFVLLETTDGKVGKNSKETLRDAYQNQRASNYVQVWTHLRLKTALTARMAFVKNTIVVVDCVSKNFPFSIMQVPHTHAANDSLLINLPPKTFVKWPN